MAINWNPRNNWYRLVVSIYAALGPEAFWGQYDTIAKYFGPEASYDSIKSLFAKDIAREAERIADTSGYAQNSRAIKRPRQNAARFVASPESDSDDGFVIIAEKIASNGPERLRSRNGSNQGTGVARSSPDALTLSQVGLKAPNASAKPANAQTVPKVANGSAILERRRGDENHDLIRRNSLPSGERGRAADPEGLAYPHQPAVVDIDECRVHDQPHPAERPLRDQKASASSSQESRAAKLRDTREALERHDFESFAFVRLTDDSKRCALCCKIFDTRQELDVHQITSPEHQKNLTNPALVAEGRERLSREISKNTVTRAQLRAQHKLSKAFAPSSAASIDSQTPNGFPPSGSDDNSVSMASSSGTQRPGNAGADPQVLSDDTIEVNFRSGGVDKGKARADKVATVTQSCTQRTTTPCALLVQPPKRQRSVLHGSDISTNLTDETINEIWTSMLSRPTPELRRWIRSAVQDVEQKKRKRDLPAQSSTLAVSCDSIASSSASTVTNKRTSLPPPAPRKMVKVHTARSRTPTPLRTTRMALDSPSAQLRDIGQYVDPDDSGYDEQNGQSAE